MPSALWLRRCDCVIGRGRFAAPSLRVLCAGVLGGHLPGVESLSSLPAVEPSRLEAFRSRVVVAALGRASYVYAAHDDSRYGWTASSENARLRRARERGLRLSADLSAELGPAAATFALSRGPFALAVSLYVARFLVWGAVLAAAALVLFVSLPAAFPLVLVAAAGVHLSRFSWSRLARWQLPLGVRPWLMARCVGSFPASALAVDDVLWWLSSRLAPEVVETMVVLAPDFEGDVASLAALTVSLLEV